MCVKSCPTYTTDPAISALSTFNELAISCIDTAYTTAMTDSVIIPDHSAGTKEGCGYFKAYKSTAFLGKYCVPNISWINSTATTLAATASGLTGIFGDMGSLQEYIEDMKESWLIYPIGFGIAVILGLIYCYFLRCFAGVITWIIIILLLLMLWGSGAMAYKQGQDKKTAYDE